MYKFFIQAILVLCTRCMRSLHNVYEFLHKAYWNLKSFFSFLCCFRFHLGAECWGACFSLRPWWFSTQLSCCVPPSAWTSILYWPSPLRFGYVAIMVHEIFVTSVTEEVVLSDIFHSDVDFQEFTACFACACKNISSGCCWGNNGDVCGLSMCFLLLQDCWSYFNVMIF